MSKLISIFLVLIGCFTVVTIIVYVTTSIVHGFSPSGWGEGIQSFFLAASLLASTFLSVAIFASGEVIPDLDRSCRRFLEKSFPRN